MRGIVWFYMLNKRLYKKAVFSVILALLLVCVISFSFISKADSGMINVVLVQTNKSDKISGEIIKDLLDDESMAHFMVAHSVTSAVEAVKSGAADTAWIFPENMGSQTDFTPQKGRSTVQVVEREQNVLLRLTREKLNSKLFEYSARSYCRHFVDQYLPELDSVSDEELMYYFENTSVDRDLFVFDNPVTSSAQGQSDYLTAPLRGLLAIITTLGGLAGTLYYMKDEEKKLFANIPLKKQPLVAFVSVGVATLNLAIISMVALFASGLYRFSLLEVLAALLSAVSSAAFCMLLLSIMRSIKVFGAVIPALITVMSFACPVFFYLKECRILSLLFPPTYYVFSASMPMFLLYAALYTVACLAAAYLIGKIKPKKA